MSRTAMFIGFALLVLAGAVFWAVAGYDAAAVRRGWQTVSGATLRLAQQYPILAAAPAFLLGWLAGVLCGHLWWPQLGRRVVGLVRLAVRPRSPRWPGLEREHLRREPECQWCRSRLRLQVHHVVPYHVDPSRELDPTNLLTLCMDPLAECHFRRGHRGTSWLDWDPDIRAACRAHRKES